MAEIACDSCGHGYYDTFPKCPKCAAPTVIRVYDPRPKYRRIGWQLIAAGVALFVLSVVTKIDAILYPAMLAFIAGSILRVVSGFSLRGVDSD